MSLTSLLNSDFVKNSQKFSLTPHKIPILIYVEDEQDISFWDKIFSLAPIDNNKYQITIKAYQIQDRTITGKDKLMQLTSESGPNFMLCVDADFDVLLSNSKYHDKLQQPYVIHTCYYAIENILSDPSRLKKLVEKEKNKTTQVDYNEMLRSLSKAIWPVFTLLLGTTFRYNVERRKIYSKKNFNATINALNILPNNYAQRTADFKPDKHTEELITTNSTDIQTVKEILAESSYSTEDTYKIMYGHSLFSLLISFLRNDIKNCSTEGTGMPTTSEVKEQFYSCEDLERHHIPDDIFTQIQNAFS